ncbi:hypothetical protein GCM10027034_27190 [Ramlibacter solisilvae]|uniref:hypothetical protein n=1 Tax=Ramlibacter tataouinensis TaxID=94132 RepID=UPI000776F7BB|nr:hypothetical protein [Ramlibacter tataouinensis]
MKFQQFLAITVFALAALTGCGGGGGGAMGTAPAPAPSPTPPSSPARTGTLVFGVNTHQGADSATNAKVAAVMKERNLRSSRMDLWAGDLAPFRDQVQQIRANGGSVQVALQVSYQWDHSCNPNLAFVEQDAYDQAARLVNAVKDIVHDFELLNETQLRPEIRQEVPWNSVGTDPAPYAGKPCVATLAAVLRGMARAIRDVAASSGLPLRVILGTVGRDFGFLTFMQQQGVPWDVTGFHVLPRQGDASLLSDPWWGPGGPLAQLARFGKPVHLNEFNCGEVFDGVDDGTTQACLRSLARHLKELRSQAIVDLESIHFYELRDEPEKPAPENRFGLMVDLDRPKVLLYLAAAFAGGALSAPERAELTARNLLTDAEITAMQAAANGR